MQKKKRDHEEQKKHTKFQRNNHTHRKEKSLCEGGGREEGEGREKVKRGRAKEGRERKQGDWEGEREKGGRDRKKKRESGKEGAGRRE